MNTSKKAEEKRFRVRRLFFWGPVWLLAVVIVVCNGNGVSAKGKPDLKNGVERGFAHNLNGREIGSVDSQGRVYNRYEEFIGSVDGGGKVYNISMIHIGGVDPRGEVRNQIGTLLGYADEQGNVYNRFRKKVGSIEGIGGLNLIGGAARLLFFKGR